jgi:uncharacterized membrane protein YsdA (DUF1294 family)/cold shock CspA family protein
MRRVGKISKWNDERGFGFITSAEGGESVFIHISSLSRRDRRPNVSDAVSYTLAFDAQGRPQANDVQFIAGRTSPRPVRQLSSAGILQIAFAVSFLSALFTLVVLEWLEVSWLVVYFAASIITYGCYAQDKKAAQDGGWRTPESTLHLLSLVGGWPGGLAAQVVLRHKTRKASFLIGFWFTVILNCIVLCVVVVKAVSPLKMILAATN